jgi:TIR domain
MSESDKSVFISYRRDGGDGWARVIYGNLCERGYKVFIDVDSIDSGKFERIILNEIEAHAHFLVLLTPRSLDRCNEPNDWLAREIQHAIKLQRNVVPLIFPPFSFEKKVLPAAIASLPMYNALHIHNQYFEEGMTKLCDRFLKQPVLGAIKPTPKADSAKVLDLLNASAHEAAARKPTDWFNLFHSLEKTSPTQASDSVAKTQPFKFPSVLDLDRTAFERSLSEPKTKPVASANPWPAIANLTKAATGNYLKPGNFRLNAVGIPMAMLEKLKESLAIGETLKQVAFGPDNGWVILRDQWGFWCQGVPEAMINDLWSLSNERQEIAYVCQAPNEGFVILRDKPYLLFLDKALPASLRDKLLELYDEEKKIKCVAISATGGWVVLFGKNGFWSDNIPVDLYNKLHEWGDLHYELKQVAFGPASGWVLLAGDNGWWHVNIPNKMAEKLSEYHTAGKTINSVALSSDSGWVILGN